MISRISLAVTLLGGFCLPAHGQIEGPKLGFAYDKQASAVRPIFGVPGAALFGEPLSAGLRNAVISPAQDFAVGIVGDESAVGILNLLDGKVSLLSGAKAAPTRIALSPNGTSVALVTDSHVQVFSGFPGESSIKNEFDLNAAPAALAVSDDGNLVLAAIAEAESSALYSYATEGAANRILTAGRIASIEFLNKSHDAVFADSLENKIVLLRGGADAVLLAQVDQPDLVAATADNRRIVTASRATQLITAISVEDGTVVSASCSCAPVTLARLQGGAVFRLTDLDDGPAWIFDSGGAEPRVLFIPQAGGRNE
jgi:hypothetical protein